MKFTEHSFTTKHQLFLLYKDSMQQSEAGFHRLLLHIIEHQAHQLANGTRDRNEPLCYNLNLQIIMIYNVPLWKNQQSGKYGCAFNHSTPTWKLFAIERWHKNSSTNQRPDCSNMLRAAEMSQFMTYIQRWFWLYVDHTQWKWAPT